MPNVKGVEMRIWETEPFAIRIYPDGIAVTDFFAATRDVLWASEIGGLPTPIMQQ